MRGRVLTNSEAVRCRSDSGAALVEAAIVLPITMLLLFGMVAVGSALKTFSSTSHAVRVASRMASLTGADPMTDQTALARLATEVGGVRPDVIQMVVIWHATGPGAVLPTGCHPSVHTVPNTSSLGVTDAGADAVGACNVYVRPDDPGGAFAMATGAAAHPASYYFGCQGTADPQAAHMVDCGWPGKDRRAATSPRTATGTLVAPDFVGVYLEVTHQLDLPIFDAALTVTSTTISLLEPRTYTT